MSCSTLLKTKSTIREEKYERLELKFECLHDMAFKSPYLAMMYIEL